MKYFLPGLLNYSIGIRKAIFENSPYCFLIWFLTAAIGNGKKVFDPRCGKILLTKSKATLKVVYLMKGILWKV